MDEVAVLGAKQQLTIFGKAALGMHIFASIIGGWFRARSWVRLSWMIATAGDAQPRSPAQSPLSLRPSPAIGLEVAPQAVEKARFAPENAIASRASDPRDVGRAAPRRESPVRFDRLSTSPRSHRPETLSLARRRKAARAPRLSGSRTGNGAASV
jgi:hypothetical protein